MYSKRNKIEREDSYSKRNKIEIEDSLDPNTFTACTLTFECSLIMFFF